MGYHREIGWNQIFYKVSVFLRRILWMSLGPPSQKTHPFINPSLPIAHIYPSLLLYTHPLGSFGNTQITTMRWIRSPFHTTYRSRTFIFMIFPVLNPSYLLDLTQWTWFHSECFPPSSVPLYATSRVQRHSYRFSSCPGHHPSRFDDKFDFLRCYIHYVDTILQHAGISLYHALYPSNKGGKICYTCGWKPLCWFFCDDVWNNLHKFSVRHFGPSFITHQVC